LIIHAEDYHDPKLARFGATVAAILVMSASAAFADAGTWAPETATDPNFIAAKKAIDAKDWKNAIDLPKQGKGQR